MADVVPFSADIGETPAQVAELGLYQGYYRGLVFGEGTDLLVPSEVQGIVDVTMRSGDRNIPRGDGAMQGEDFAAPSMLTIPLLVLGGPQSQELADKLQQVYRAFAVTPNQSTWLYWRSWSEPIWAFRGRVTRSKMRYDPRSTARGTMRFQVGFKLADPRRYNAFSKSEVVPNFVTSSGRLDLPIEELPTDFSEPGVRQGILQNDGNVDAWPEIKFQHGGGSDLTQIILTNLTNGDVFSWDGSETPLLAGQTLTADMDGLVRATPGPHVFVNGSSRYGQWSLPRNPFRLSPGENRIILTTVGTDVVCRLTWRDTWL